MREVEQLEQPFERRERGGDLQNIEGKEHQEIRQREGVVERERALRGREAIRLQQSTSR